MSSREVAMVAFAQLAARIWIATEQLAAKQQIWKREKNCRKPSIIMLTDSSHGLEPKYRAMRQYNTSIPDSPIVM